MLVALPELCYEFDGDGTDEAGLGPTMTGGTYSAGGKLGSALDGGATASVFADPATSVAGDVTVGFWFQQPPAAGSGTALIEIGNTAGGYVSISTKNRGGNAALTAGRSTLAMGLLECVGLVVQTGGPCVLVVAEEALPEPLAAGRTWAPLAAAFALAPVGGPEDRSHRTCRLDQGVGDAATMALPAALAANPCSAALALVDAYLRPQSGAVAVGGGWRLTLDAPGFPAVRELVPQRPPMLLLGAVIARSEDTLTCTATVAADWLLVDADGLPAAALLEVMAQAVAALHGLQGRARGEPVRVGLLLGARDLALHVPRVRVGAHLVVRATQVFGMDAIAEFVCRVEANGACLAEGTLHVVRGDLEAQPA